MNDELMQKYIWSSQGASEIVSGVCKPLVGEFYIKAIEPAIRELLDADPNIPSMAEHNGRLYFNLSLAADLFGVVAGDGEAKIPANSFNNKKTGAIDRLRSSSGLLKVLLISYRAKRKLEKILLGRQNNPASPAGSAEAARDLKGMVGSYVLLSDNLHELIALNIKAAPCQALAYLLYLKMSRRWCGQSGNEKFINRSSGYGLSGMVKDLMGIGRSIEAIGKRSNFLNAEVYEARKLIKNDKELSILYDKFQTAYGHRTQDELDFSRPRWSEDDSFLISSLKKYIGQFADGDKGSEVFCKASHCNCWYRRLVLGALLEKAQKSIRQREEMKSSMMRFLFQYRQAILRLGSAAVKEKLIHEKEDIFYLKEEEIKSLPNPNKDLVSVVATRKKSLLKHEETEVVEELGQVGPNRVKVGRGEADTIQGIGVSAGKIKARARTIMDVGSAGEIKSGEILVTDHTDPGWTPLFALVGGVVTASGGVLSHAAVLARECGLPAVAGIGKDIVRIKDGAELEIDGETGVIRLILNK